LHEHLDAKIRHFEAFRQVQPPQFAAFFADQGQRRVVEFGAFLDVQGGQSRAALGDPFERAGGEAVPSQIEGVQLGHFHAQPGEGERRETFGV